MLTIKRRLANAEVETFEIPEDQLQQYKTVAVGSGQSSSNKEAIDLYKMEYETCAKRYNDLYSAAWTNFSYMALFAGGILTFGGNRFVIPLTAFLACLPLLFWWVATFEPLNRYGDDVQYDLGKTEQALNLLAFSTAPDTPKEKKQGLSHYQVFANRAVKTSSERTVVKWIIGILFFLVFQLIAMVIFLGWQLQLNTLLVFLMILSLVSLGLMLFFERPKRGGSGIGIAFKQFRRVRFLVRTSAAILLITAICFGIKVSQMIQNKQPLTVPKCETTAAVNNTP